MSTPKVGQYKPKKKTDKVSSITSVKWGSVNFKYSDGRYGCVVNLCPLVLDSGLKASEYYGETHETHKKLFDTLGQMLKDS